MIESDMELSMDDESVIALDDDDSETTSVIDEETSASIGAPVSGSKLEKNKKKSPSERRKLPRYFEEDISTKCYRCGKIGHIANDCENELVRKPCYLCGKTDHLAKNCAEGACKRCGRLGHRSAECRSEVAMVMNNRNDPLSSSINPKNKIIFSKRALENAKCIECGAFGHLVCGEAKPNPLVYLCSKEAESKLVAVYCCNCGEKGHDDMACRKKRVEDELEFFGKKAPRCFGCNQEGHVKAMCPLYFQETSRKRNRTSDVYSRHSNGFDHRDSDIKKRRSTGNYDSSDFAPRCFSCGQRGHIANVCTAIAQQEYGGYRSGHFSSPSSPFSKPSSTPRYSKQQNGGLNSSPSKNKGKRQVSIHRKVKKSTRSTSPFKINNKKKRKNSYR